MVTPFMSSISKSSVSSVDIGFQYFTHKFKTVVDFLLRDKLYLSIILLKNMYCRSSLGLLCDIFFPH